MPKRQVYPDGRLGALHEAPDGADEPAEVLAQLDEEADEEGRE